MTWQKELAQGFKNPEELLRYLELSPQIINSSAAAHQTFKTLGPKSFVEKMMKGDPNDPLLRQVLPVSDEMQASLGYTPDPLQEGAEKQHRPLPGLLHKYSSRVLLTLTSGCAVNCRYCFRRHFDYQANRIRDEELANIVEYIKARPDIHEVILSGGDPLLLNDDLLKDTISAIETISTVKILRFHTRMPIVLPSRITSELATLLKNTRLHTTMVLHANHPNELDDTLRNRLSLLRSAGTHLLNQSVLLKGVNNNVETLCQLSYRLLDMGVLPYYLHLLDKVQGAAHFDIEEKLALALHENMRKQLPGYLLPKLVREIPGELSKMPVF